jgi:hypothetical protein
MHLIRENQNRRLWRDAVHLLIHRNGALPARNHDKFKRTVQMRRKRQAVSLVELQIARIQRMRQFVKHSALPNHQKLTHPFYQKSKELSRAFSYPSRPETKKRPQQQNGKLFFVCIDHAKSSDPQKRFHVVTVEKC